MTTQARRRRRPNWPLWVAVGLHMVLVARLFALSDALGTRPFAQFDYKIHYYEAFDAAERLRAGHLPWGYNPFWMAGFPEGLIGVVDNKIFFVLFALVPSSWRPIVYNLTILLVMLLPPLSAIVAARMTRRSPMESAGATVASTVATFLVPMTCAFWQHGGIAYFAATFIAVPLSLAVAETLGSPERAWRFHAVAAIAFAMTVLHPITAVLVGPGVLIGLAHATASRRVLIGRLVLLGALFVIANLPIFLAFAENAAQMRHPIAGNFMQGGLRRFASDWMGRLLRTGPNWDGGAGGLAALLLLAVGGWVVGVRDGGRPRLVDSTLFLTAGACLALTYGCSWLHFTATLEPYRFIVPAGFFLAVPAGVGLARGVEGVTERRWKPALLLAGSLAIVAQAAWVLVPPAVLGSGYDVAEDDLAAFLERETTSADRILVDVSGQLQPASAGATRQVYVGRFLFLPLLVHRELIGHVFVAPLSEHSYAGFFYGKFLGRPLEKLDAGTFRELLDRYAASWIVAWRPETIRGVDRFPAVAERVAMLADVVIYRVRDARRSRFLEGSGESTAGLDRIDVTSAEGDRLVLKYHWTPTLSSDPPLQIEEVKLAGMPAGFIGVRPEGRSRFSIVDRATRPLDIRRAR